MRVSKISGEFWKKKTRIEPGIVGKTAILVWNQHEFLYFLHKIVEFLDFQLYFLDKERKKPMKKSCKTVTSVL